MLAPHAPEPDYPGSVKWDRDYPGRRPTAGEVMLTLSGLLISLAAIIWSVWTFEVWTNGKLTLYDAGMPIAWVGWVFAARIIWRRQSGVVTRSRLAASNAD